MGVKLKDIPLSGQPRESVVEGSTFRDRITLMLDRGSVIELSNI